jgi:hypothetical protein
MTYERQDQQLYKNNSFIDDDELVPQLIFKECRVKASMGILGKK